MRAAAEPPGPRALDASRRSRHYWDRLAAVYQEQTVISCREIHYGPLVPGDSQLGLLPPDVGGWHCLELGCGAGQNSICLARRGARCLGLDHSAAQLRAGAALARQQRVSVAFVQADMEVLPLAPGPHFDLVHSAYALPFVAAPAACLHALAARLRPGGLLLLSTAHPLWAGEWLQVDQDEGLFLTNYFEPPAERRTRGAAEAVSQAYPISTVFAWLTAAGLVVEDLREPAALPTQGLSPAQLRARVPYWSPAWLRHAAQLARVPIVAVFKARKPA